MKELQNRKTRLYSLYCYYSTGIMSFDINERRSERAKSRRVYVRSVSFPCLILNCTSARRIRTRYIDNENKLLEWEYNHCERQYYWNLATSNVCTCVWLLVFPYIRPHIMNAHPQDNVIFKDLSNMRTGGIYHIYLRRVFVPLLKSSIFHPEWRSHLRWSTPIWVLASVLRNNSPSC